MRCDRAGVRWATALSVLAVVVLAAGVCASRAAAAGYLPVAVWGDAGTAPGQLALPKGVAVDAAGIVYVADYTNCTVIKYAADGTLLQVWGGRGGAPGQMRSPSRVAVAADGTVYVTDADNDRIQRFSPDGDLVSIWGRGGDGRGEFDRPRGVAFDAAGHVYVADQGNRRVQVFTPAGGFLRAWGGRASGAGRFSVLKDLDIGPDGRVYLVDAERHCVMVYTRSGRFIAEWGRWGTARGRFRGPRGIAVDSSGRVFVADAINCRIQEFTSGGAFVREIGCAGELPGLLREPRDVALAPDGSLVVSDTHNARLQRYALSPLTDRAAPLTTSSPRSGWRHEPVAVTLDAADEVSGVAVTYVRRGRTASFAAYTAPIAFASEGRHVLQYLSVDGAGNQETTRSVTVWLDWTAPRLGPQPLAGVAGDRGQAATLRFTLADQLSPRCRVVLAVLQDGATVKTLTLGWRATSPAARTLAVRFTCPAAPGRYTLRLSARDLAGNVATASGALRVR
jgi:DNA-binding beta-propeller fold protein YncE